MSKTTEIIIKVFLAVAAFFVVFTVAFFSIFEMI